MSKVKIQGNASGTGVLTLEAPNTNTDRTITLPDGTGTVLMSDGDGSGLSNVGVDGIVSSANATAITIDSSERVGIGHSSPTSLLHVKSSLGNSSPPPLIDVHNTSGAAEIRLTSGNDAWTLDGHYDAYQLNIKAGSTTVASFKSDGTSKFFGGGGLVEQYINSGNMTMGVDAVYSVAGSPLNTGALISIGSRYRSNNSVSYVHGLFMGCYGDSNTVMLADFHSTFANNDQIYKVCCYSSSMSGNLYIKNRLSLTNYISISVLRYQGN
jgi:hypothetical protein